MTASPRISVVMAVRNASRFLRAALDSIAAQTQPVLEAVVVDGRSTDATEDIARGYPFVRFMQESRPGYASAWNDGIRASRGDLVAFLDSDDRWAPDKLRLQTEALAGDPDARGAIGYVRFEAEPGPLPSSFRLEFLDAPLVAYMPGALLVRRALFDEIGLFDPDWEIANDIDWFAKMKDRGLRLAIVPDVVLVKRVHDRNTSYLAAETSVMNTEIIRVLRRSIHRQRRADPAPE